MRDVYCMMILVGFASCCLCIALLSLLIGHCSYILISFCTLCRRATYPLSYLLLL